MFTEPKTLEEIIKFNDQLVECFVLTMPLFKDGLSAQQRRDLIREHIGDLKAYSDFKNYRIDKNMIFARTCQALADEHGLNNSSS